MRKKISLRLSFLIAVIVGILGCSAIIAYVTFYLPGRVDIYSYSTPPVPPVSLPEAPEKQTSDLIVKNDSRNQVVKSTENLSSVKQAIAAAAVAGGHTTSPLGKPTRLKIPIINVNAQIDEMGITPDGAMEAPEGPKNVGWFKFGAVPGDKGSAVIAGHFGRWKSGGGSVFDNLNKLKEGDKIYVEDEKGATASFVVRGFRTYGKDEAATDVFSSVDGKARLNLVTCEGIWDKDLKTYSNRFVVFADKAN